MSARAGAQAALLGDAASLLYAGIVFADNDSLAAISTVPTTAWPHSDFAAVAQALGRLHEQGTSPGMAEVLHELRALEVRDPEGLMASIAAVDPSCAPKLRALELCEAHARRRLTSITTTMQQALQDGDPLADVRALWTDSDADELLPKAAGTLVLADIANTPEPPPPLFHCGLWRKTVSVLGSESGLGKSMLAAK